MKVSELSGPKLDYWAGKASQLAVYILICNEGKCWLNDPEMKHLIPYSPSTDWAQGGPIIEREKINVQPVYTMRGDFQYWNAKILGDEYYFEDVKYLIAAMRAYVASKIGETVPDE